MLQTTQLELTQCCEFDISNAPPEGLHESADGKGDDKSNHNPRTFSHCRAFLPGRMPSNERHRKATWLQEQIQESPEHHRIVSKPHILIL